MWELVGFCITLQIDPTEFVDGHMCVMKERGETSVISVVLA